ncbi:apses-domain-containing protein [Hortaea werneckii]|nr:apses-domain-containing protein [Hortaea werneckii]
MPPTPQQSFSHMPPAQASPQGPSSQPPPPPQPYGHGYSMSFDSPHGAPSPMHAQSQPVYSQTFPNGPMSNPGYARSFGDNYGPPRGYADKPQIYTAVYSGVSVYEMEIHGVACMRRRSDGWLNATQILKVAGVDKGKRTKVLEKEILTGEHEKVQGGYGKYQGTWISYRRGREFCRQYGVEDILKPLLDYDVSADGSGGHGQETPTKEQAMAANRKRFYNHNLDGRPQGPISNGTFFQNISPTTSVALAAMNKAARLNSPGPRPSSAQRPANMRRPSQQDLFPGDSQQSIMSEGSYNADGKYDSGYGTQPNGVEPPRKRMRRDSQDEMAPPALPQDESMRSITPTEPNESFMYDTAASQALFGPDGEPIAKPPLPTPTTEEQQEKINLILELFADPGRTDYASHDALTKLSGEDLNMPLDYSANNALHWAATLAKVPLLKLLIQRGANIWRGNAAGQSPLISAVLVNNCWERSCFPELLELFGPLIEVRDAQGRTILHHIAVSSGIKGRAPSSKYYLEALLEYLVRIGTQPNANISGAPSVAAAALQAQRNRHGDTSASQEMSQGQKGSAVSLVRFLSHIVNARDKAGNTALNLVARIGNRSIIQQLLEIHADPSLPNYKGVSAKDFGVGGGDGSEQHQHSLMNGKIGGQSAVHATMPNTTMQQDSNSRGAADEDGNPAQGEDHAGNQIEDLGQDLLSSMTNMLTQNLTQHKDLLKVRTEQIDRLNEQLREFSAMQKADLDRLQELKDRVRVRGERQAKVANLRRAVKERKEKQGANQGTDDKKPPSHQPPPSDLEPTWLSDDSITSLLLPTPTDLNPSSTSPPSPHPTPAQHSLLTTHPTLSQTSPTHLLATLRAYESHNTALASQAKDLSARSQELEALYRKVVSLCTGVEEEKVEGCLGGLIAAVESEQGGKGRGAGAGVGGASGFRGGAGGGGIGRGDEDARGKWRGAGDGNG